jgi:Arc/MetJ-type ribon-helix-helix transcriptional regulator
MAKTRSIRIDESLFKAVDAAARAEFRSRSEVFREALRLWLGRRTLEDKVRRHREGYARQSVKPDEFEPILRAQRWPK